MEQIDPPLRDQGEGLRTAREDGDGDGRIHLWIEFALFLALFCALAVSIAVSFHNAVSSAGPAAPPPALSTSVR